MFSFGFNVDGEYFNQIHIPTNVTLISVAEVLADVVGVTVDVKTLNVFVTFDKLSSVFDTSRFHFINDCTLQSTPLRVVFLGGNIEGWVKIYLR